MASAIRRGCCAACSRRRPPIVYLVALAYIPFAIATAVNLSTPLFLTVLAVLLLKEEVRWRRWSAVAVGFVGVLMVIQPRPGDLNTWTWLVVLAALHRRLRDVLARYVPRGVPTLVVSFTLRRDAGRRRLRLGALLDGWQPMSWRGLALRARLLAAAGHAATSC